MSAIAPKNNVSVSMTFTGLAMILSFSGLSLLLVMARRTIPTVDEIQSVQRLKILADLNAENAQILNHYHWIDKTKGVVGIPIDRAMDLVLVDLRSTRPPAGPVVTPASANNAPPQGRSKDQTPNGTPASSGDPKAGEVIFKQCAACHSLDPDTNKQGPTLAGLFGRHAGSIEDFNYSDANRTSGIVWDEAMLRKYIANPQAVVPGTKMTFQGLKDPQQVEDVIAFLKIATKTK
jgi:cytochrome c